MITLRPRRNLIQVVEELVSDSDYVWVHDYHLLVLPSLLRKRFNRIRCGLFLHSPFPSSEIFRCVRVVCRSTFPERKQPLRSLPFTSCFRSVCIVRSYYPRSSCCSCNLSSCLPAPQHVPQAQAAAAIASLSSTSHMRFVFSESYI